MKLTIWRLRTTLAPALALAALCTLSAVSFAQTEAPKTGPLAPAATAPDAALASVVPDAPFPTLLALDKTGT